MLYDIGKCTSPLVSTQLAPGCLRRGVAVVAAAAAAAATGAAVDPRRSQSQPDVALPPPQAVRRGQHSNKAVPSRTETSSQPRAPGIKFCSQAHPGCSTLCRSPELTDAENKHATAHGLWRGATTQRRRGYGMAATDIRPRGSLMAGCEDRSKQVQQ